MVHILASTISLLKYHVTHCVILCCYNDFFSISSTKNETAPAPAAAEPPTKLVLKPIMSTSSSKEDQYVPCIRGNHALGELVVVGKRPPVEAEEEPNAAAVTPKIRKGFRFTHKAISRTSSFKTSTPASSRGYHKRRKRINRRWANSRGRLWKAKAAASPTVVHSPSLTVAMQPELDDVEGLLFVSFTSKVKPHTLPLHEWSVNPLRLSWWCLCLQTAT